MAAFWHGAGAHSSMSMNKKKIIWPLIKTILLFLSYKCKNWVFQYLFHSCFQCIQQGNHSDNFQQDQHMWPRFCIDQSHTRPHLWIKLKNSSFMSCCSLQPNCELISHLTYLLNIYKKAEAIYFEKNHFTCFTVASSVSSHAITAITSSKIHTCGSVLAWSERTLVDV